MMKNKILQAVTVLAAIVLIATLALLSQTDEDPCANPQGDVSAAVLADADGDQDALINRAIIMRGECDSK